ncbi:MAG: AmmeMemoRadiSam system protein B [Deltaproteobacteria bacterium]|nr:AmmeMemoRadiSam system protein B [Deltaproteobacteria bacterium]
MLRKPAVAGQFYPGSALQLEKAVKGCLIDAPKEKAVAAISPHAGYIYSGHVAGALYSSIEIPDNIILIGPNHTGLGEMVSVMTDGEWETPLGIMKVNGALARMLLESSDIFSDDMAAHEREHSLEVQLPFIYTLNKNASFVPITVMRADFDECSEMGLAIARVVAAYGKHTLILVSSDMNHYESDKTTRKKDELAIGRALALDASGLLQVTAQKGITMCGVIPAAIAIVAAKELGAKKARLVKYATSGETSGDYGHVVGYAGIVIS